MSDHTSVHEVPSMPSRPIHAGERQVLHQLDAGLHALYAVQGRIQFAPDEAALLVQEVIALIEGVIPELRRQLQYGGSGAEGREGSEAGAIG